MSAAAKPAPAGTAGKAARAKGGTAAKGKATSEPGGETAKGGAAREQPNTAREPATAPAVKEKPPPPPAPDAALPPIEHLRRREAAYCRTDPVYFVEQYVKIEDKDAPALLVPFRLWPAQRQALRAFAQYRRCIVLKARQLGLTWLALAEASRLLALTPGRTVVALSRSEEEAKELVRRMGVILRGMPEFAAEQGAAPPGWQGPVFRVSAMAVALRWPDGPDGVFKALPSGPSVGRSFTADLILLDEWAFQQFAEEIWRSAFPVINRPEGGRVIGLSTIRRGSLFEALYTDPNNGFHKIFLPWNTDPRRDEAWYRATLLALGEDGVRQEYPASVEEALAVPGGAFFPELAACHRAAGPPAGPVRRYVALDYGLDMLSAHWVAVDEAGRAVVYRELDAPGLTIGQAARAILAASGSEEIELVLAPSDLWGRSQESGKSRAQLFYEAGLVLTKTSRDFPAGCAAIREWLALQPDGRPRLAIADRDCPSLWHCLAHIQKDPRRPDVYAKEPHPLTHDVDSLRCFCIWWAQPAQRPALPRTAVWTEDLLADYERAGEEGRAYLEAKYGPPY